MELTLKRIALRSEYTIGKLYVDGKYVCDTIEDTVRDLDKDGKFANGEVKIPGKTAIPYGRYEITMKVKSPKYSNFSKYSWAKKYDGYLPRLLNVPHFDGVLIHCLTPDTEILTEFGWQNLYDYKLHTPSKCYSYNVYKKCVELVSIDNFVEHQYIGKLYTCNGKRVCYQVTDEHRMYFGAKKHDGTLEWKFDYAKKMVANPYFLTSAIKDGEEITEEQKTMYRLIMATQADGYIVNWSSKSSQVRFHFKKERKINRLKSLLEDLHCEYKCYVDCEGKTHITLDNRFSNLIAEILNPDRLVTNHKNLPLELLNLKSSDMKDLVLEYLFWDGRYNNYVNNNKNMIITSTNERTIDILQAMCTMSGMRTNKHLEAAKGDNESNCWDLIMYENQEIVKPSNSTFSTKDYNGIVWCLHNYNTTLIIRNNGRTMIIGNCGNAPEDTSGCILVGQNKAVGKVLYSVATFNELMDKYLIPAKKRNEKIVITII